MRTLRENDFISALKDEYKQSNVAVVLKQVVEPDTTQDECVFGDDDA